MQTEVHLKLDAVLVARAKALGPLDLVVDAALRRTLEPADRERRQVWIEANAILIEALGDGAAEAPAS
jgi:hypothetical protein